MPLKTAEEHKEDEEVTERLAAAKKFNADDAVATLL